MHHEKCITMSLRKYQTVDLSTAEKIKEAARIVFSRKGYAATRTRDIAEEAGINLALVNYYFRSKEKLFNEIMHEKVYQLFGTIVPILINPSISFDTKIEIVADSYIEMLIENPDLPLMVMSEIKNNPEDFGLKMQIGPLLRESSLMQQIRERKPDTDPMQIVLSIIGMMVFPFIARPVFTTVAGISKEEFMQLMKERKQYIINTVKVMMDN